MNMKLVVMVLMLSLLEKMKMQKNEFKYRSKQNIFIDLDSNKVFLLDSFKVNRELFCVSKCNQLDTCVSCVYNADERNGLNCFLYNRRITAFSDGAMTYFNKLCPNGEMRSFDTKCFSLKAIFDKGLPPTTTIQNVPLMIYPMEYYILPYVPHNYYITNYNGGNIMIFDRNWKYLSYFSITNPREIRIINNFTYILGLDGFRKFDYSMKVLNYVANDITTCNFLRLHYSEIYSTFYISNCINKIDLFDLNLSYLGNITLINQKSMSFREYDGKIYASTQDRTIFVIQNRTIISSYTNICATTGELRGLCIDYEGYMAVTCTNDHTVFLYHINGTNTYKTIVTPGNTFWAKFDLNGNLAVCDTNLNKIYLYN